MEFKTGSVPQKLFWSGSFGSWYIQSSPASQRPSPSVSKPSSSDLFKPEEQSSHVSLSLSEHINGLLSLLSPPSSAPS